MDRVRNLLEQIQSRLEDLNKAERKVAEVTEQFLIRNVLVAKEEQGLRQLTAEGRDHFVSNGRTPGV